MKYVLEANGIYKNYGHFRALDGLTMHVPEGAIYGFVGKNGLRYKLKKLSFTSLR